MRPLLAAAGAFALTTGGIMALISVSGPALAGTSHSQTATFAVAKMRCATCPIAVKTAMKGVPGVQSVKVSFEKKLAVVVFDPSRAKPATIAAASTAIGFPATLVH